MNRALAVFQKGVCTNWFRHHLRQRFRVARLTANVSCSLATRLWLKPWFMAEANTTIRPG